MRFKDIKALHQRIINSGEKLYRRTVYLVVAVIISSIIISTWYQAKQEGEEVLMEHTERLARVILSQARHEARVWFLDNNLSGLNSLASHLSQQEGIIEVSIQDYQGQNLVREGHDQPLHNYLRSLPTDLWAVPMVDPVMDRDGPGAQLLGFVRITFDYDRIMAESRPHHRLFMRQNAFMLFMAAIAGFMVATAMVRRRKPLTIHANRPGD